MKRTLGIIGLLAVLVWFGTAWAGPEYVLGVSKFVMNSNSGVSTTGPVDERTQYALVGVGGATGASMWWLPGGMSGIGTVARGIAIPADRPLFRIDGCDAVAKSQFSTCGTSAVTAYVIFMGKP